MNISGGVAGAALGGAVGGQLTGAIGGLSLFGLDIGTMLNSLTRDDPEITYNFSLEIGGLRSVHFKEVGGLKMTTKTTPIREGGNNLYERHLIDGATFEPLKIKRGYYGAHDDFYNWLRSVHEAGSFTRQDFSLIMLKDDWTESCRFNFFGGFPTSWSGPTFDSEAKGQIAFEEIEIRYDYFDIEKMSLLGSIVQGGLSAAVSMAGSLSI
jgi:phage tail-like protein